MNIERKTVGKPDFGGQQKSEEGQGSAPDFAQVPSRHPARFASRGNVRSQVVGIPSPVARPGSRQDTAFSRPLSQQGRWTYVPAKPFSGETEITRQPIPQRVALAPPKTQVKTALYLHLQSVSSGEAFVHGLISASAVSGIAYGLLCGFDLVSNWGQFSTGILRLIQ